MTMRRSSSVRPSWLFHRAMSAFMFTSCGIQWLAQPSRYFCQAQSYLNGTSWLRSARQLIMRFSSTWTRAAEPSRSVRPSTMSSSSSAALARATASESSAVTARASLAAASPTLSSFSRLMSAPACSGAAALVAPSSGLSNSSQLSMAVSPAWTGLRRSKMCTALCARKNVENVEEGGAAISLSPALSHEWARGLKAARRHVGGASGWSVIDSLSPASPINGRGGLRRQREAGRVSARRPVGRSP